MIDALLIAGTITAQTGVLGLCHYITNVRWQRTNNKERS